MYRKILEEVPKATVQADLDRYRQRALQSGATDARIISTNNIIIDERVRAKCLLPRCENYGTSAHCPPHAPALDEVRAIVAKFQYAVLFKFDAPSATLEEGDRTYALKSNELVTVLESQAYYDGYYLAVGFGGTACKGLLCTNDCQALEPGQSCRFPYQARVSMHGAGMDVYRMAAREGWEIYPVGAATTPSDVPFVSYIGLVLVY